MAKVMYIQGTSKSVKAPSDKKKLTGATTFWHIRKPRSHRTTLCGAILSKEYGVVLSDKKPEPKGKHDGMCHSCTRINAGKDPVFDKATEQHPTRDPEDIGTRANSQRYTLHEQVMAGEKLA